MPPASKLSTRYSAAILMSRLNPGYPCFFSGSSSARQDSARTAKSRDSQDLGVTLGLRQNTYRLSTLYEKAAWDCLLTNDPPFEPSPTSLKAIILNVDRRSEQQPLSGSSSARQDSARTAKSRDSQDLGEKAAWDCLLTNDPPFEPSPTSLKAIILIIYGRIDIPRRPWARQHIAWYRDGIW
jgi:hypothetical protein